MKEFSVIDESFDPTLSSSYFLSIQFSLGGFSFCTLDPIQNLFIQFKHFEFDKNDPGYLKNINLLHSEPNLKLNYKKVFILFGSSFQTLVPNSIFKKDKASDLLNITFDRKENFSKENAVLNNKIKMADAYNVFSVQQTIIDDIQKKFANVQILHSLTPFIEANLLEDQRLFDPNETHIHLSFDKSSFHVIVVEKRELTLSNTFEFKSDSEIIYYLFFIFDQLKLDPATSFISISGEIIENKNQLALLKRYIKRLTYEKPEKSFNFSPEFRSVKLSRYTNLFNSPICV